MILYLKYPQLGSSHAHFCFNRKYVLHKSYARSSVHSFRLLATCADLGDFSSLSKRGGVNLQDISTVEISSGLARNNDKIGRLHPATRQGKFQEGRSTLTLPLDRFIKPIRSVIAPYPIKHIRQTAENVFGGVGLPYSPFTPKLALSILQKPVAICSFYRNVTNLEACAYATCIMPAVYVTLQCIMLEIRQRLGSAWLRNLLSRDHTSEPMSILDTGSAGVAGLIWKDMLDCEWQLMREDNALPETYVKSSLDKPPSYGNISVVVGSKALQRITKCILPDAKILESLPFNNVASIDQQGGKLPSPARKRYDLIVVPHTLWALGCNYKPKHYIHDLWNLLKPGGVLIFMEKGTPRGFEVIASTRHLLLEHYMKADQAENAASSRIIGPCSTHETCPMLVKPGETRRKRKTFCRFSQRFLRPSFLQHILRASRRNFTNVEVSYLSVIRSSTPFPQDTPLFNITPSLPRLILPPIKRKGHVIMDLCCPTGKLERWIVPRSYSRQAYQDARKAKWGDFWALGAKTRRPMNLRLGRSPTSSSKET